MQLRHNITTKRDLAQQQLGLLKSQFDILANLASQAQAMGIDIKFHSKNSIVIRRWQFSREFHDPISALRFLEEMGVKP